MAQGGDALLDREAEAVAVDEVVPGVGLIAGHHGELLKLLFLTRAQNFRARFAPPQWRGSSTGQDSQTASCGDHSAGMSQGGGLPD